MIDAPQLIVLLDACVLYPAPLRDFLLHIADRNLFSPKWTNRIQDEWTRNLLLNRADLTMSQLQKTIEAMNGAFPDATVIRYEGLINSIHLPDANDRHVLAAAIRCHARIIVTANLKDFPRDSLSQYDIEAQHPDDFISSLLESDPEEVLRAFQAQVATLKKPPKTAEEVLEVLQKNGLKETINRLKSML